MLPAHMQQRGTLEKELRRLRLPSIRDMSRPKIAARNGQTLRSGLQRCEGWTCGGRFENLRKNNVLLAKN
jgi:hypothetical protein